LQLVRQQCGNREKEGGMTESTTDTEVGNRKEWEIK
jgi:hypothetical protein